MEFPSTTSSAGWTLKPDQNVNSGEHFAGEDTFVFKAGETGVNTIHDFNIGGVNDEIVLVGIDNGDVTIVKDGTKAVINIAGSSQTIIVKGLGDSLGLIDIDFA